MTGFVGEWSGFQQPKAKAMLLRRSMAFVTQDGTWLVARGGGEVVGDFALLVAVDALEDGGVGGERAGGEEGVAARES